MLKDYTQSIIHYFFFYCFHSRVRVMYYYIFSAVSKRAWIKTKRWRLWDQIRFEILAVWVACERTIALMHEWNQNEKGRQWNWTHARHSTLTVSKWLSFSIIIYTNYDTKLLLKFKHTYMIATHLLIGQMPVLSRRKVKYSSEALPPFWSLSAALVFWCERSRVWVKHFCFSKQSTYINRSLNLRLVHKTSRNSFTT